MLPQIIPIHERDVLPVDDTGWFYILLYNLVSTVVGGSAPTVAISFVFAIQGI
jgi:hypothetical protein